MINIERVFDPALTAKRCVPETVRADWLKRASGEAGTGRVELGGRVSPLEPEPEVGVREARPVRRPSGERERARMELGRLLERR